ncbi:hypothetical protein OUZ56_006806 [Daphnia magna]|uniref:Uncharacterized protein n=1 Tax=Daphnia magna TaxID=35525 RepID=A0ABQ9YWQ8_9CRUS|nr:hypothetical protein OUZ56_006806 [Daphnia magna]
MSKDDHSEDVTTLLCTDVRPEVETNSSPSEYNSETVNGSPSTCNSVPADLLVGSVRLSFHSYCRCSTLLTQPTRLVITFGVWAITFAIIVCIRQQGMYTGLQETSARFTFCAFSHRWIKPLLIALERLEAAGIGFGG